jgi:hypothetical protein
MLPPAANEICNSLCHQFVSLCIILRAVFFSYSSINIEWDLGVLSGHLSVSLPLLNLQMCLRVPISDLQDLRFSQQCY